MALQPLFISGWEQLSAYVQWAHLGSPDKHRGLSIQPCKSEREKSYILWYI